MQKFDVIVIGAGASGLFCAGLAGKAGLQVLLIDHNAQVGNKIKISGGGRCNFTNIHSSHKQFISAQNKFCQPALSQFTAQDFVSWMKTQKIPFHEKHKGQLFCDSGSQQLINALLQQCEKNQVTIWLNTKVEKLIKHNTGDYIYQLHTSNGIIGANNLVVATGGLSIPKIGASDLGYRIAKDFAIKITNTVPALVPLTFDKDFWLPFSQLSGVSLPVIISTEYQDKKISFTEDLLFTHRGLSGPAILQISSYWQAGQVISVNLLPQQSLTTIFAKARQENSNKKIANLLSGLLPARLIQAWLQQDPAWQRFLGETSKAAITELINSLHNWQITPSGSEGYKKAEVTKGGIDCNELDAKTMEIKNQKGLYFIGEVVDVTGWLGGYNFQWAWSSAYLCSQSLIRYQLSEIRK